MTPDVTIAVLTFRRPHDIAAALPLLAAQARSVDAAVRVLVVDNDADGSAREVVESADSEGVVVDYVVEPEPGIASARNRALAESAESTVLVFIDDDERPSEGWLESLLTMRADTQAEAVVGPVVSEFPREPDPWIVAGGFFVRRRLPSGTRIDVAATNNLLLDLDFVRAKGLSFDVALGALGGEDTLFTRQIVARGGTMVWCAEAVVADVVPLARLTRRWVVQRAFSSGNGWSLTALMLAEGSPARARLRLTLSAKGGIRAIGGMARIVRGFLMNSMGQRAKGVRTLARGAGMLAGAWGYSYREYRR